MDYAIHFEALPDTFSDTWRESLPTYAIHLIADREVLSVATTLITSRSEWGLVFISVNGLCSRVEWNEVANSTASLKRFLVNIHPVGRKLGGSVG